MSTYRNPVINNNKPELVDDGFYTEIKIDQTSDSPNMYIGLHTILSASTSLNDWKIYKIIPSGADTEVKVLYGSYDQRASL